MDKRNPNTENIENVENTESIENTEEYDSLERLYGKPKMSKQEKIKNFLYYNKVAIIVGAIIVVVLGVLIGQLVTKKTPDVYIMYAGRYYIDPKAYQGLDEFFVKYMNEDYNKDGEVFIEIINKTIKTYEQNKKEEEESNEELYMGNYSEELGVFQSEIAAGQSVILFIDTLLYENIKEQNRLMPLSDVLGYTPDGAMDEYGILLGNTPFANAIPEFKSMLDNTVVCIKRRVITCDQKVYNNNLDAFKKLFEAEYPQPVPTATATDAPKTTETSAPTVTTTEN